MPRICPEQLLNCLSVLLSQNGGIKSRDEVQRLASLMTKFSKKLVSKCIYIQILKCTETDLLGLFMGSGGWRLLHMWLTESIVVKNWPLVKELLELLLLCPVDIERLKTNNCPKLVKELSRDSNNYAIRALASKLVEQWLKTVKGEQVGPILLSDISQIISDAQREIEPADKNKFHMVSEDSNKESETADDSAEKTENSSNLTEKENGTTSKDNKHLEKDQETLPVLKITLKNGKQVISQVEDSDSRTSDDTSEKDKTNDKLEIKSRDKSSSASSNTSSSSKRLSKSSSSEKSKSSHKSSSSKHSRDRSKDKDRHSSYSSKSKHNSSSSYSNKKSSSSSSKSKDDKSKHTSEKEKNKDKEDRSKNSLKPSTEKADDKPSIQKLGKIPKLSDVRKEKPSISIEVRKPDDPKPKTVKTFNSKFRKHGLEEEVKPPPSRASLLNKKSAPVLPSSVSIPKRPSPVHNEPPPEKKLKTIDIDKPGAIKLIPPKPKRKEKSQWPLTSRKYLYLGFNSAMLLLESDKFMDALNASATTKKEPKKRKRRTSGSKDGNAPNDGSPPHTPTNLTSPNSENKSVPPRFYQDTLETEESKHTGEKSNDSEEAVTDKDVDMKDKDGNMDVSEPHTLTVNGLKGVLCYHKRKGPKKRIKWKPDSELEEIQYFEFDETERVNVAKPSFNIMEQSERTSEGEALKKRRNLNNDIMEEKTSWKPLIPFDFNGQILVECGKNSKEKDIQAARQKVTLPPVYYPKYAIPDSPNEPEIETHPYSEPTIIPLDDPTGNQDSVTDFRNMPWPEPKREPSMTSGNNMNVPSIFPPNMQQIPSNFLGTQFPGVPQGFPRPPMVPGDWPNGVPAHIIPNGIPGSMPPAGIPPPGSIPPNNMPPGMMMPPETLMMAPDMFNTPNNMFPVPPDGFNMQQNMYPMDYNMAGQQGMPGPETLNGVGGNFRGGTRGRGAGGHWRGKSGGNWEGPPRGRGGHSRGSRKVVCMYFQRKGSCRQGDNCTFLHPGVNCPY